jgi:hypothetical protein
MVFFSMKIPTIQNIFSRDKDGNYTKDALLYQDILKYSVRELESPPQYIFKKWNLIEWLISHNLEMTNDYKKTAASHMTKTNKIQARKGRVDGHISVLMFLGLLGEKDRVKESKGDSMVTRYSFTRLGSIIALLLMMSSPTKKVKAITSIYKIFRFWCEENPSSIDEYNLSLLELMLDKDLFVKYLELLLCAFEKGESFSNMNDLLNEAWRLVSFNPEDCKKHEELRKAAFERLSSDAKKYFMHKQKLEIERKMFGIANNLRGFEELSFKLKNDYDKLATEGYCKNCKLYIPLALSLIEYLQLAYPVNLITTKCPKCGLEKSVEMPFFQV